MNKLNLTFYPIRNIQQTEYGFSSSAHLGVIKLTITTDNGAQRDLLSVRWDITEILSWLLNNAQHIIEENLPKFIHWDTSIAKSICSFYDADAEPADSEFDRIFEYRQRHELCFGLRGAPVPIVYLGRGQTGGEVSAYIDDTFICYNIDLEEFITAVKREFAPIEKR